MRSNHGRLYLRHTGASCRCITSMVFAMRCSSKRNILMAAENVPATGTNVVDLATAKRPYPAQPALRGSC
jgi:hypothetical protein